MIKKNILLPVLLFALLAAACQREETTEPSGTSESAPTEASAAPAPEVTYEPAYPTDVSEEALSAEDEAQQQSTHAHGEGEGEHSHDTEEEEGEHPHDEGEDDDHDH